MENQDKLLNTIRGLKKYNELISDLIRIIDPKSKEMLSGSFITETPLKWNPTTPNAFIEEELITEKELIKLGFHRLNYPELSYQLNEETALILVCSESKWYAAIHQFQGLKPPMDRVYIPKDIKLMDHVKILINALSEK